MKKKKIIGYATGATVAVSLAIGGAYLNNKPADNIEKPPIQEESVVQEIEPIESVAPSPTPSPTAMPIKTEKPQATSPEPVQTNKPVSTLEEFGIFEDITVNGTYSIEELDENRTAFNIVVPEELSADIYELYLNNQFVDKSLISKKIIAPPIVFSVPELLEVRIFKLQEVIAVGTFKDGKVVIAVKDGVLND